MSDDGFLFGEKFSKGKRSLDYDATKKEQGRTGKKAKAVEFKTYASEQRDSSQEAKETQSKCYSIIHLQPQNNLQKHTPNECLKMKTAMVMKLRKSKPSGEALISQKKHENGKTEESHTLVNSLENKKVNASNESVALLIMI